MNKMVDIFYTVGNTDYDSHTKFHSVIFASIIINIIQTNIAIPTYYLYSQECYTKYNICLLQTGLVSAIEKHRELKLV